jgi:hypothetical protein
MTIAMVFPKIQSQQATSISGQQTTSQQTSGIDISGLINLMMPIMIVGMMMKMMSGMVSTPKRVKAAKAETTPQQPIETATTAPIVTVP